MPTQQMKNTEREERLALKEGKNLDHVLVFPLKRFQNRNSLVFQLESIQLKFLLYTTGRNFGRSNIASQTFGISVAKEIILIFFFYECSLFRVINKKYLSLSENVICKLCLGIWSSNQLSSFLIAE